MNSISKTILKIVDEHSRKAAESEYDRGVAILAISTAREQISRITHSGDEIEYKERVVEALESLKMSYNDTDGQYTNGKGSLGALIDDINIKAL